MARPAEPFSLISLLFLWPGRNNDLAFSLPPHQNLGILVWWFTLKPFFGYNTYIMTKHETLLTGLQPTGRLHIGNYLGTLRNCVKLQREYQCFFMVADYHAITEDYDPKTKYEQIIELTKEYIAAGLDPKKCTIFAQSDVAEHPELAWIFNTITPMGYLERMTQYKDKSSRQADNINVGLFDYPVLMAADILLYKPSVVPVGQDQDQHLELTREIVRLFNNKFGATFTEPKTVHTETPKIMSLLTPDKKMSKSAGENHCIFIDDEPEVIAKKLSRAVTDSGDGAGQGAKNLLELLTYFSTPEIAKQFADAQAAGSIKYSELKTQLAIDIAAYFADFRKKKAALSTKKIEKILAAGAKRARLVAKRTMTDIRKKVGVRS
jgi:tryptophanyl-tRNA synthetase